MREPLYRQALKNSWHLTWDHKILWVFGLLAVFCGQMGLVEILTKLGLAANNFSYYPNWLFLPGIIKNLPLLAVKFGLPLEMDIWLACLLLIFLGIGLFLVFAAVVAQGGLIKVAADFSKRGSFPSVGRAWNRGVKCFWPLLLLNIIKKLILTALILAVGYVAVNALSGATAGAVILFLVLFILTSVVGMAAAFLLIYAAAYIVVEDYHFVRAAEAAWQLFIKHWLVSVEVGLIILALNVVVAMLAVLGFFVFFLPTLITWFIAVLTLNSALWWAGFLVGILFSTLLMIFLGALLTVYTTSVWTYLFMKMHHEGISSRILRWLKK